MGANLQSYGAPIILFLSYPNSWASILINAVNIEVVSLSKNGQQFLVSGSMCGFGARSPMYWVYEDKNGNLKLIGNLGAADNVKVSKHITESYTKSITKSNIFSARGQKADLTGFFLFPAL